MRGSGVLDGFIDQPLYNRDAGFVAESLACELLAGGLENVARRKSFVEMVVFPDDLGIRKHLHDRELAMLL